MKDPDNEYIHKVLPENWKAFHDGKNSEARALCGKVWAPTEIEDKATFIEKPQCPECFPPQPKFEFVA